MIGSEYKYTIKNLNREKIFKSIIKTATIKDVKFNDEEITFTVAKKSAKNVEKVLNQNSSKILSKKEKGLFCFLKGTIFRIGVIIPVVLFCVFAFVCNNFVLQYEILGLDRTSKQEVEQILVQEGINGITFKGNINLTNIENKLNQLKNVSLVSCILKGNTLVVNIKEKVYNAEFEEKDNFQPIVSLFNGTITSLTVIQGTALVRVGQTVKVGQQLVSPYVTDTSGSTLAVKPMANILADVYYTTTTQIAENQILYKDTQNVCYKTEMFLFGVPIFIKQDECDFKYFKTEEVVEYVGRGGLLPIVYKKTKYTQQEQIIETNYFTKNREVLIEQCKQKTRQQLKSYEIIKDEYTNITSLAQIYTISHTVVVNKSII